MLCKLLSKEDMAADIRQIITILEINGGRWWAVRLLKAAVLSCPTVSHSGCTRYRPKIQVPKIKKSRVREEKVTYFLDLEDKLVSSSLSGSEYTSVFVHSRGTIDIIVFDCCP